MSSHGGSRHGNGDSSDKSPPASTMLWAEQLRKYVGSGAGLGSEALTGGRISTFDAISWTMFIYQY